MNNQNIENFINQFKVALSNNTEKDFCQKNILDGIPFVFFDQGEDYYKFRSRIGEKFNIEFNEIFITGSAKLGFSYSKKHCFLLIQI